MEPSFGEQLKYFAISLHIVDAETCEGVRSLVDRYFVETLGMDFYQVQVDGVQIGDNPGLSTPRPKSKPWTNDGRDATALYDDKRNFTGHSAYCYVTGAKLWITAPNGQCLSDTDQYTDSWSHRSNLPRYVPPTHHPQLRTSIVMPLKYAGRTFGFLNLEHSDVLKYSKNACHELERIADAIAALLWNHKSFLAQADHAQGAFRSLDIILRELPHLSPLSKPRLFVASSSRAAPKVIGVIREVLGRHEDKFEEVYWKTTTNSGDINTQLLRDISRCRFGLCYFSEPARTTDDDTKFIDNPNVIFEAGMLHSLSNSMAKKGLEAWIPIREAESPPQPFDFAAERSIIINRFSDGNLNSELFSSDLEERLRGLLSQ